MTIRELFREFAAARLRAEDTYRRDLTLAWQISRLHGALRSKRGLQPLSIYLDESARAVPAQQTYPQMRAVLRVLSESYGIPIRQVTRG